MEMPLRGLNRPLQIEADIISFRFFNPFSGQMTQPGHINRGQSGFVFLLLF